MKQPLCPSCNIRPKNKHANAKWCRPCATERQRSPRSNMTPAQVSQALALRGKHPRPELARRVGVSVASIGRLGRELGVSFSAMPYATNPEMVAEVAEYYAEHGGPATAERYPYISIRSVIERYEHEPRQVRWTDEQIMEAARMAGLVSMDVQSKIFGRPRANAGSIKSLWQKRLKQAAGNLHGMSYEPARHLLRPGFPTICTQWWNTRRPKFGTETSRRIVLWCDMGPWLLDGVPPFIREAVWTMAGFQHWLFGTDDPKSEIEALLRRAKEAA